MLSYSIMPRQDMVALVDMALLEYFQVFFINLMLLEILLRLYR